MFKQERAANLESLGRRFKLNIRLFYTGKATCATSGCYLNIKMREKGWSNEFIVFTHGSDLCPYSQSAMLSHRHPQSSQPTIRHVFGDFTLDGRVTEDGWRLVQTMLPTSDMTKQAKVASYNFIWHTMLDDKENMLRRSAKGWCFRHKQMCPILDSVSERGPSHPQMWKQQLAGIEEMNELMTGEEAIKLQQDHQEEVAAAKRKADKADTTQKEEMCTLQELAGIIAGTTCTDFCGYSAKNQDAGQTNETFNWFCLDVVVTRPVFFVCEISGAEVTYYEQKFGGIYGLFAVHTEPIVEGIPAYRDRLYTFGWDRVRSRFVGSEEEYFSLVSRKCSLSAVDFLITPKHRRKRNAWKLAASRGNVLPVDAEVTLGHQLTACALKRFNDQKAKLEKQSPGSSKGKVVDLEQNPTHASPCWARSPLVTHGTVVTMDSEEMFDGEEHLFVQGEAVPTIAKEVNPRWQTCLGPFIRYLRQSAPGQRALKKLAGNSMIATNIFSFKLYCLANLKVLCLNYKHGVKMNYFL